MSEDPAEKRETCRACTATCADGSPCRAWAVRGSDPPRCSPHGGGRRPVGAPKGNQNARSHGFFARTKLTPPGRSRALQRKDNAIADLCIRHLRLIRHIEEHKAHLHVSKLALLFRLYRANLEKLLPLVRHRYGAWASTSLAFKAIFTEVLQEQGIDLHPDPEPEPEPDPEPDVYPDPNRRPIPELDPNLDIYEYLANHPIPDPDPDGDPTR